MSTSHKATGLAGGLAVLLACAACGSNGVAVEGAAPRASTTAASTPSAAAAAVAPTSGSAIVAADFSTTIDNTYLPLRPRTRLTYEGQTADGFERIVVEVTDRTKVVAGVTCVVVRDTVTIDGEKVEDTYDWYAQHRDGTVWYFGEDTTEFENGKPVNHNGAWEAGVDGAVPGVVMPAAPQVGDAYRQEFYAGVAEDEAKVLSITDTAKVPAGSYSGVVKTEDFTKLDATLLEHKYYARGIGFVLEVDVKNPKERIGLVKVESF